MEENNNIPGKGAATASLVLGIISVVLWFFGYSALVSVILGIVGLILAATQRRRASTAASGRRALSCP